MNKNNKISGFFLLGTLWVLLFIFIGSTCCYGDSSSINSNAYQESVSLQKNQGYQFIALETADSPEKLPFENEKETEEENAEPPVDYFVRQLLPLKLSISPTYQNFLLTIPQQKRYLLFLHLKIYC